MIISRKTDIVERRTNVRVANFEYENTINLERSWNFFYVSLLSIMNFLYVFLIFQYDLKTKVSSTVVEKVNYSSGLNYFE